MAVPVKPSPVDRQKIQEWLAAHGTPQQVALRCRIVIGAAEGESDSAIRQAAFGKPEHGNSLAEAFSPRRDWTVCGM